MDAENLFYVLHAQFKASALVNFHGTYSIEEDDDIAPKECTHMLAEELCSHFVAQASEGRAV